MISLRGDEHNGNRDDGGVQAICKRVSERICQMDCGFRVRLDGVWVCATCQRVYTDSGDTK